MLERPEGLWPFTHKVLDAIESNGFQPPKVTAHDASDDEEPDFICGELTPHLELSEGEYMRIDQEAGEFSTSFGMRGCCGGDATYGGYSFFQPTKENALKVALQFVEFFTRKG